MSLLELVQVDAPWVVSVERDPRRHVVKLVDASGDWRAFPCSCFGSHQLLTAGVTA